MVLTTRKFQLPMKVWHKLNQGKNHYHYCCHYNNYYYIIIISNNIQEEQGF